MFIEIDPTSSQPIFEQIAMQIRFAIAAGTVREEEMIPSVRDLSKQLTINPNTTARAYRLLQDEGLISLRRGMGLAVTVGAKEICRRQRKLFFQQKFQLFLDEAARSRLSQEEIDEIMENRKCQTPF
ncbi:MAG: GntR family transcriptional regulator [Planctomycetaceae bacterium]|jgi:GntR family transcriptional regulator|nr:GntR family transcriptional regulator [Planctomycetaceae bacterium]